VTTTAVGPRRPATALTRGGAVLVALRAWSLLVSVRVGLLRHPLPELVTRLSPPGRPSDHRVVPARLGHLVGRVLRIGPWRPRCLFGALVLYRLLRRQGDTVQLVIGLPESASGQDAHAWVEWEGTDVGPPPGGRRHVELARFG